ncbi:ATP-binding protein [Nocardia farcinica]|uniref:ATP-binding protein n=1 Tax=Nocardia farcinica TaxID=37329 RepID=UPI0024551B8B|nr:ATP-binding protein [Nocardia farcinica]
MVDPGEIHTREDLQQGLAALHWAAGISYLDLAGRPGVTASQGSIHAWVKKDDPTFPQWGNLAPVLRAWGVPEAALAEWQAAHARAGEDARLRPGVPLGEVLDPFALEVHESITTPTTADVKDPPFYVRRAHDDRLGEVVAQAAAGTSGIAVLLGDSSTGKTRALWEALAPLRARGGWRLWVPSRYRPEELSEQLGRVGPRTVVWLNETQRYFQFLSEPERGRLAETLHALLADGRRGPVLILGSLWHQHYATLCTDPGSATRKLLGPATIEVPASFTGDDLAAMRAASAADPRLQMAVDKADDGQITQYLAGGPELVDFYEKRASKVGKAVITAAMDLVRLGHANAIPLTLLREASTAYIDDTTWATRPTNWFETALAEISQECKGARGPVTPADDRTVNTRTVGRRRRGMPEGEQRYQLADYLDQHSRRERAERTPTVRFWEAAADHADAENQNRLGDSAWHRGLYRDAAQLWKTASKTGHCGATSQLFRLKAVLPDDKRPRNQAVADIRLDDPYAAAGLLNGLRAVGADEQIQTLLDRDPANHIPLDNPYAVSLLLNWLRAVGAEEQFQALLDREPANHIPLDDP